MFAGKWVLRRFHTPVIAGLVPATHTHRPCRNALGVRMAPRNKCGGDTAK